jgi:flagellar biosynthesis protein FliR
MELPIPDPILETAAVFLIAMVRMSGIFIVAPFWSGSGMPVRMKVGLALFLTVCAAPLFADRGPEALARISTPLGLVVAGASELSIGFVLGMAGAAAMAAIQTAGGLIAQDMGLTIANVIDPITSSQNSVVGQLQLALALFVFLALDFHHALVRLVVKSFELIPLGGLPDRFFAGGASRMGELALSQGSAMWDAAVRLALPVSVTLFLVTIAMGFLGRAVPEMNIFILGFPLRVLVGLWVLVISVPLMAAAFGALFERAARDAAVALRVLAGG